MNHSDSQLHMIDALLNEALLTCEFDVTEGIIGQELIGRNGVNYTRKMGLTVPYSFDDSFRDSVMQKMGVTCVFSGNHREAVTRRFLLDAFANGRKKVESVILLTGTQQYLKLTYYLWQSAEDGHVWTFIVCEPITAEWEIEEARIAKLKTELQNQINMAVGLANAVIIAYQGDLITGEYISAKVNDFSKLFTENGKDIREAFAKYVPQGVQPEDVEKMKAFVDIDTLKERLAVRETVDLVFHSRVPEREWCRAKWTATARDREGAVTSALFTVEDVTETVKRRYAEQLAKEEQYQTQQYRMQTMMEAIHGGFKVGRNDAQFSFITISRQLAEMLGYDSPEEMMEASGGSMAGIVNREDAAREMPEALRCVAEGRMYTMRYRMRCKDGRWKNVEDRGRLVRGHNGSEEYWSFIIDQDDLTRKTEALEAAERAKAEIVAINQAHEQYMKQTIANQQRDLAIVSTLANAYIGAYYIDLDTGLFREIHQASVETLRIYVGEAGNARDRFRMMCELLVIPEQAREAAEFTELSTLPARLLDTNRISREFRGPTVGWWRGEFVVISRDAEGRCSKVLWLVSSIREEKEQQEKLKNAMEEAKIANEAKTAFLFNMSHDIRTPMNVLLGYSKLMRKELTDPKLLQYQEKMEQASEFLLSLINDVLEMARIESGKMEVDNATAHSGDIIAEMYNLFEASAREKGLVFSFSRDITTPYIMVDTLKIKEIYNNLISNSIKYTPAGGSVSIRTRELPGSQPGYIYIESVFEDTGIGMSKEYLNHIFEEFSREKNTTQSRISGTGLGMAIVKKLVDLLGGTITIESELGKGTRTVVTIPHQVADAGKHRTEEALQTETGIDLEKIAGMRILLAEDNELNAEIAMTILEDRGFRVDLVDDGIPCVERIEKMPAGTYDLILMDIQMPQMDGYKATHAIRNLPEPEKARIPIIAMTANAFERDRKAAFEAGMNGHVAKPIDYDLLIRTIANVMK